MGDATGELTDRLHFLNLAQGGWQIADYMRKARPDIRVVLMTGYAQPNATPLGPGTELLMKPFVRSTLELRLTRLFGRERA